jgi:hypothetical protein
MMEQTTRYRYEQRIKELEKKVCDLEVFKDIAIDIHDTLVSAIAAGNVLKNSYLVGLFRRAWR